MSGSLVLKNGLMAAACVAGLTLTACASHGSSTRYGASTYDYESGGNCGGAACDMVDSRYGAVDTGYQGQVLGGQTIRTDNVVYADCSQIGAINCGQQPTLYSAPAQTYTQQTYQTQTAAPAECPAGTTPNGDGTCMQGGGYSYSSNTTTSYSAPTYSNNTSSYGGTVDCPAGTTPNGDGTCMQGSSYSGISTSSSSTSYSSSSSSYGEMVDCPSGTTRAADNTCMMSSGTNVEIYNNTGYQAPADYTPPTTYLPIRK